MCICCIYLGDMLLNGVPLCIRFLPLYSIHIGPGKQQILQITPIPPSSKRPSWQTFTSNHWTPGSQGRSVRMTTHQHTSGSYFLCLIHAPSSVQGGGNTASTYLKGILIRCSPSNSSAEGLAEEIFPQLCLVSF